MVAKSGIVLDANDGRIEKVLQLAKYLEMTIRHLIGYVSFRLQRISIRLQHTGLAAVSAILNVCSSI